MPACPACFGEGEHDLRDQDAFLQEHLDHPPPPAGIVPCDECEGTGVVSALRLLELEAYARASVSQTLALFADMEREGSA